MQKPLFYLLLMLLYMTSCVSPLSSFNAKVDVGVILDLQTIQGKMYKTCISMAIEEFYSKNTNYSTVIVPHFKDSREDVVSAASAGIYKYYNTSFPSIQVYISWKLFLKMQPLIC